MKTNALSCNAAQAVLQALQKLRTPLARYEDDIHRQVEAALTDSGMPCIHEAKIGVGCRADFLVGSVVLEIKKGRPSADALRKQLTRYAACEGVEAIIVIAEANIALPKSITGKPVYLLCLRQLWGVALP